MSLHLWTHKSSANEKFLNPVFNWQLSIGCKLTLGFIPGLSFFQFALLKKKKNGWKEGYQGLFFTLWSYWASCFLEFTLWEPTCPLWREWFMQDKQTIQTNDRPVIPASYTAGGCFFQGWDFSLSQPRNKISAATRSVLCHTYQQVF